MKRLNRKSIETTAIKLDLPKNVYLDIAQIAGEQDKSRTLLIVEALVSLINKERNNNNEKTQ